jgi:hypothetical protein
VVQRQSGDVPGTLGSVPAGLQHDLALAEAIAVGQRGTEPELGHHVAGPRTLALARDGHRLFTERDRPLDVSVGQHGHGECLKADAPCVVVAVPLAEVDGLGGRRDSVLELPGEDHEHRAGGRQRRPLALRSSDGGQPELLDALRVARPHREHAGQPRTHHDVHARIAQAAEHPARNRLRLTQPPAREDRLDQLALDLVMDRVVGVDELERVLQQSDRRRRRPRGAAPRRAPQPCDSVDIARVGAAHQVIGDALGRGAGESEHRGRLPMESLAHRLRQVAGDGLAEEVVAERQAVAGFPQHPGIPGGEQGREQLSHGLVRQQRQLGGRERAPQDRRQAEQVQDLFREQAQAAQERQDQARGQGRVPGVRATVGHLDGTLRVEGTTELDDEEGVAACPRHLLGQPGTRRQTDHLSRQPNGVIQDQWRHHDVPSPPVQQIGDRPVDLGTARSGAHRHEQRQRQVYQVSSDRVERPDGEGVGPLQVLHGERDRTLGGQPLDEVDHGHDDRPTGVRRSRLVGGVRQPVGA